MPHRGSDQGEDGRGHGRWRSYSSKEITLLDPLLMLQHILHTTTGDWCVLYQLGWIDENGKENNETSTADLMSLKPEVIKSRSRKVQSSMHPFYATTNQVLAELDESAMATCAQERVAMIGKMMEKKHKR